MSNKNETVEPVAILTSLSILKETCKNLDECDRCPMYNTAGECGVSSDLPKNWKINKPNEIWRALM